MIEHQLGDRKHRHELIGLPTALLKYKTGSSLQELFQDQPKQLNTLFIQSTH